MKTPLSNSAGVVSGRGFPFYLIIFFLGILRQPFSASCREDYSAVLGEHTAQLRVAWARIREDQRMAQGKRILDACNPRQTNRCSFLVQTFSRKRISSNYATKSPRPGWFLCAKKPAYRCVLSFFFCHTQRDSGHLSPGRGRRNFSHVTIELGWFPPRSPFLGGSYVNPTPLKKKKGKKSFEPLCIPKR